MPEHQTEADTEAVAHGDAEPYRINIEHYTYPAVDYADAGALGRAVAALVGFADGNAEIWAAGYACAKTHGHACADAAERAALHRQP